MNLFSDRSSTLLISTNESHVRDKFKKCTDVASFALPFGAFVYE